MNGIALHRSWLHGPTAQFLRHLVEMILAMVIGMVVLGLLVRVIASALGYPNGLSQFYELSALLMTLEMTLAMAAWMLYRGHRIPVVAEMSGAMIVPAIVVVALCLLHVLPGSSASLLADVGMYAAMLGVMLYRRSEYTGMHGSRGHAGHSG
jgi:uncharacterized membrane protein